MANSKRRCTHCRQYFPQRDFYRGSICSVACLLEHQAEAKARKKKRRPGNGTDVRQRQRIRRRDNQRCRLCGATTELHVHHILYRSQGGPNEDWNLITLCEHCHTKRVHADKRRYQPLCRAYIWLLYVEGRQLTLPEIERRVVAQAA